MHFNTSISKALLATSLAAIFSCTACNKNDDDGGGGEAPQSSGSFRFEGTTYNADANSLSCIHDGGQKYIVTLPVAGKVSTNVTVTNLTGAGTYSFEAVSGASNIGVLLREDQSVSGLAPTYNTMYATSTSTPGSITITEFDADEEHIKGTFSFTAGPVNATGATGEVQVTEGTFDIHEIN